MSEELPLRVLIVDDTLPMYMKTVARTHDINHMFATMGLNTEVSIVENAREALEQQKQWAAEGNPAQLISADYQFGDGINALKVIMDAAQTQPELKPKQCFIHSKSGLNAYSDSKAQDTLRYMKEIGAQYAHTFELVDIAACSAEHYSPIIHDQASTTTLRDYLKATYPVNTNSPVFEYNSKKFMKIAIGDDLSDSGLPESLPEEISPYELHDEVRNGNMSPIQALKQYNPMEGYRSFSVALEDSYAHGVLLRLALKE